MKILLRTRALGLPTLLPVLPALLVLLISISTSAPSAAAQDDFLTPDEVDAVRDAQEPEQRIPLYLEIAQLRLGSIRAAIASVKSGTGRTAQKKMGEYTEVLEALETAISDARERRSPFPKAMELLKKQLPEARQFLESLDNESSPLYADYRFTLEEAVDITDELIEDIGKGMFPEVDQRSAPTDMPSAPPRPTGPREQDERRRAPAPAPGEESGPPRKSGAPAPPTTEARSPEDGPPRKSDRQ